MLMHIGVDVLLLNDVHLEFEDDDHDVTSFPSQLQGRDEQADEVPNGVDISVVEDGERPDVGLVDVQDVMTNLVEGDVFDVHVEDECPNAG